VRHSRDARRYNGNAASVGSRCGTLGDDEELRGLQCSLRSFSAIGRRAVEIILWQFCSSLTFGETRVGYENWTQVDVGKRANTGN
jgi:hypothetical protein